MYGDNRAGLQFTVDVAGGRIWADWVGTPATKSLTDVTALLVGPVLGGLLRQRGAVSLHGCVLAVESGAAVLLGPQGVGKSTIAAAMAQAGHAVVSDDVAALAARANGTWNAQPGYPRLRLTPAAIDALARTAPDVGPVLTGFEKRYVELSTAGESGPWRFQAEPLPVATIYELRRDVAVRRPVVERLSGSERVAPLLGHGRAALAPPQPAARAHEFASLTRLSAAVQVRRLTYPDDLNAVPEICETVAADTGSSAA